MKKQSQMAKEENCKKDSKENCLHTNLYLLFINCTLDFLLLFLLSEITYNFTCFTVDLREHRIVNLITLPCNY